MIRFYRKARAQEDKFPEALQWSLEITEYLNSHYPDVSYQVFTEGFGDFNTIYWFNDYENLTEVEEFNAKLQTDEGYWKRLAQIGDLFVEESGEDRVMFSSS
jgi:hypothetical protein